jgi:glycerol-3-phosphate dehydrogenase
LLVAVPFGPTALVGTTELPWDGRDWFAVPDEIGYLLRAINAALPDARLEPADVWCAFTGVRPLLRSPRGSLTEASRQHGLFIESEGLLSIGGGKLTTYRAMAEETVNTIACQLGRTIRPCQTGEIPLEEVAAPSPEEAWNPPAHRGFRSRSDMDAIRALAARESFLGRPIVDGLPYPFAEVLFALQEEMAMTLEDILVRRTPVFYEDRRHGLGRLNEVVELAGRFLGWDEGMRSAEAARYREFVQRSEPDRSPSAGRA